MPASPRNCPRPLAQMLGRPNTVGELIAILQTLPPEKPVRVPSLSHEFPPTVSEHERCVTLEP
jgi:hypothetical protein